jgi:hypothetical protein
MLIAQSTVKQAVKHKNYVFIFGIAANLMLLGYFKYANFVITITPDSPIKIKGIKFPIPKSQLIL